MSTVVLAVVLACLEDEYDAREFLHSARNSAERTGAAFEVLVVVQSSEDAVVALAMESGASKLTIAVQAALPMQNGAVEMVSVCAEAIDKVRAELADVTSFLGLLPACAAGDELAARLAIRHRAVALGRIVEAGTAELNESNEVITVRKSSFGGRATAALTFRGAAYGSLRGEAILGIPDYSGEPKSKTIHSSAPISPLEYTIAKAMGSTERRLQGAKVVVSGGRGMGGPAGFEKLRELAGALNGALGASLPTVDAGWATVSNQVGQSGAYVRPEVYIAVGISGTPQHFAGISHDARIVAINCDPEAEIFKMAEIGCVCNWEELLPTLLQKLAAF